MFSVTILNAHYLLFDISQFGLINGASMNQIKAFQLIKATSKLYYLDYLKMNTMCIYDMVKDYSQIILGE